MERKQVVNLVLWPVALLVLNSLWMSVAGGVAPYEINDKSHAIETRTVELESVFGQSKAMPAEFDVEFAGVSVDDGHVSWAIRDSSNVVVAQWSGMLSDGPPTGVGHWSLAPTPLKLWSMKASLLNRFCTSNHSNRIDSRGIFFSRLVCLSLPSGRFSSGKRPRLMFQSALRRGRPSRKKVLSSLSNRVCLKKTWHWMKKVPGVHRLAARSLSHFR